MKVMSSQQKTFCYLIEKSKKQEFTIAFFFEILASLGNKKNPSYLVQILEKLQLFSTKEKRDWILYKLFSTTLQELEKQIIDTSFSVQAAWINFLSFLFSDQKKTMLISEKLYAKLSLLEQFTEVERSIRNACARSEKYPFLSKKLNALFLELESVSEKSEFDRCIREFAEVSFDLDKVRIKKEFLFEKLSQISQQTIPKISWLSMLSEMHKRLWQERLNTVGHYIQMKASFVKECATEAEFEKWYQEKVDEINKIELVIDQCHAMQNLSEKIEELFESSKKWNQDIQSQFVFRFLEYLSSSIQKSNKPLEESSILNQMILNQMHNCEAINKKLVASETAFKNERSKYLDLFYSNEFNSFRDLSLAVERVLKESWHCPDVEPILTRECVDEVEKSFTTNYENRKEELKEIAVQAKSRMEISNRIESVIKECNKTLGFLNAFIDLVSVKEDEEKKLITQKFSRGYIEKVPQSDLKELILSREQEITTLVQNWPQHLHSLHDKLLVMYDAIQDSTRTIERRLSEFFSSVHPYPDVQEIVQKKRELIFSLLKNAYDAIFSGKETFEQFQKRIKDIPYEQDIVAIRNEFSARASRLRDIRGEVLNLERKVLNDYLLLKALSKSDNDIATLIQKIPDLLKRIEDPFSLFAHVREIEDVNSQFRTLWIELESYQKLYEEIKPRLIRMYDQSYEEICRSFEKTLDSIERVVQEVHGARPTIIHQFVLFQEDQPKSFEIIQKFIQKIETAYRWIKPVFFFMTIQSTHAREALFKESLKLTQQMDETIAIAKELQWLKTFEEERIDEILEVFERYSLIEFKNDHQSSWNEYKNHIQTKIEHVEEDVFFDVGLLDMRAIMDVNPKKLTTIIQDGLIKARIVLERSINTKSMPVYIQKLYHDFEEKKNMWLKKSEIVSEDPKLVVEHLRSVCHLLFDRKTILASQQKNPIAHGYLVRELLLDLIRSMEQSTHPEFQNSETINRLFVLGHNERLLIETMDPHFRNYEKMKELLKKITSDFRSFILKFAHNNQELITMLEEKKKSIEGVLMELEEASHREVQVPFFYFSGNLCYFRQNDGK